MEMIEPMFFTVGPGGTGYPEEVETITSSVGEGRTASTVDPVMTPSMADRTIT
jgi:hypothetical protein